MNPATLLEVVTKNLNMLVFPEEWLALDRRFSKLELIALLLAESRGEMTMTELAEAVHAPMSTATGLADRLVRAGCLARERSEADRRVVALRVTDAGRAVTGQIREALTRTLSWVTAELTPEEELFLAAIITKVFKALANQAAASAEEASEGGAVRAIPIE